MSKHRLFQSLIPLSVLSAIVCWKILFTGQNKIGVMISDSLMALVLLGFGESICCTLVVGSIRFVANTIEYVKSK